MSNKEYTSLLKCSTVCNTSAWLYLPQIVQVVGGQLTGVSNMDKQSLASGSDSFESLPLWHPMMWTGKFNILVALGSIGFRSSVTQGCSMFM